VVLLDLRPRWSDFGGVQTIHPPPRVVVTATGGEAPSNVHGRYTQHALACRMLDDRDQLAAAAKVGTTMTFLGQSHLCDHDTSGLVRELSDQAVDEIQQLLSCLLTGCRDVFAHLSIAPDGRRSDHSHDTPLTGGVNVTTAREVGGHTSRPPVRKRPEVLR